MFRPGDSVICERDAPAMGTWRRYAGRRGFVVTSTRGGGHVEYGVTFEDRYRGQDARAEAWFLASELRPAIA